MPLVDCNRQMGTIRFVRGSHRYGDLADSELNTVVYRAPRAG